MSDFTRDFVADLEIRSDGTGRTIHGIVVPWDSPARVSDGGAPYMEAFQRGSFTKHLAERSRPVKLLSQHDRLKPMGVATNIREDAAGLYGEFRISDTQFGNDQLQLVRDGVLDGFSIGFRGINFSKRGGVLVRTEAALTETSLVTFGAYPDALVMGIRSALAEGAPTEVLEALIRALDTHNASTPTDGNQPGEAVSPVTEPASATPDASSIHRSLRLRAREIGLI